MDQKENLQSGYFYHIFTCGINGEDLFRENKDCERFLWLYEKYMHPVSDTYAWVLMKNHFHLLIKIKESIQYKYSKSDFPNDKQRFDDLKWETVFNANSSSSGSGQKPKAYLHLSHLLNAYSKYFNIKYQRHGSLFERPFNRKMIDNPIYFRNVVIYIHQNPVHHGFCNHPVEYGWSSYLTCISLKPTQLSRATVIGWFDNLGNFKLMHAQTINRNAVEDYLAL